jgi:uncharacterized damage-inducible protein DinB/predicted enzyme related to lactoylglutathione lyase
MTGHGKIDYIEFPGSNLQAVKRFYRDVFGWDFEDYGPTYVAFDGQGADGGFEADLRDRPNKTLVVLYVDDLEAMRTMVLAFGGVITRDVFSFPGGRRFHFRDPSGNELGVWSETPKVEAIPPRARAKVEREAATVDASATGLFRAMAHNNAWSNHRLLLACAELDDAAFNAPRTGFFPSLARTLNHILTVDWFYVDALEGGALGPAAWVEAVPYPTLPALRAAQRSVDRRLIAVCDALTPESLSGEVRVNRGARVQVERRDRLLLHLFQHQIHHRGQAHAMLSGTAVRPPQLDEFYSAAEAPLRAIDFADLGWTEEGIWGA